MFTLSSANVACRRVSKLHLASDPNKATTPSTGARSHPVVRTSCISTPARGKYGSVRKSQLEQLSQWTVIVEDTGDFDKIRSHQPQDATTNPSLVFQASELPQYACLVEEAVSYGKSQGANTDEALNLAMDRLACLFGREISKVVPGYVSTEVDARLSFDTKASLEKAHQLLSFYEELGVDKSRILTKLASTWEMMLACEQLEKEGIKTNMTLMFSLAQAVAAAQRNATLISPFVGRILDWFKKSTGKESYPAIEDPGVLSVKSIYDYYKCHGIETIVMGASFRNKEEIIALAGCDRLTISPGLIEELSSSDEQFERVLSEDSARECGIPYQEIDEKTFRWLLNEDPMASEKLSEGIRGFTKDIKKLEDKLRPMLEA
ncbi:hypothetical protein CYMTET_51365 [Cymbomonas tetramitiformis]|uniref:transaldolase n=1 Tax=Cymbomonas tetramitiformis TaxID=36881 RepID=A0AAE0BMZ4_9CHLO|nr:hypothetical protein CYMTET_51365 [Cymbomonas tetramitiformis]